MLEGAASEQQKRLKNGAPAPEDVDYSSLATLTVVESLKQVDGEDFLMYDDSPGAGGKRIQMWACQKNLDFLAMSDIWLSDGTFKVAPNPFLQGYAVHGFQNGYVIPCCYFLLGDKKQPTYKRAWEVLFQRFHPDEPEPTLLLDYEKAAYQAASEKPAPLHERAPCPPISKWGQWPAARRRPPT